MKHGGGESTGAQQGRPRALHFAPYRHPQPQERHSSARTTRSMSIPGLARSDPPAHNLQTTGIAPLPPSRRWIPQVPYTPARTRGNFAPTNPILFSVNGALGIPISQAVAEEYTGLDGRDDGISSFERGKAMCRIQFSGHDPYKSKINTRHNNADWTPIKRSKLAKEIGRRVEAYIEEQGLQGILVFEKIYLTRLIHVSKGSWQPELSYKDPAIP